MQLFPFNAVKHTGGNSCKILCRGALFSVTSAIFRRIKLAFLCLRLFAVRTRYFFSLITSSRGVHFSLH